MELAVFSAALKQIIEGYPVGVAIERFNRRYLTLLPELNAGQQRSLTGEVSAQKLGDINNATCDARNWVLIGDPAVRIRSGEIK